MAGNREGKLKSPVVVVSDRRMSPVASLITDTFAAGIKFPEGSVTVPEMVPVVVCVQLGSSVNMASARMNTNFRKILDSTSVLLSAVLWRPGLKPISRLYHQTSRL